MPQARTRARSRRETGRSRTGCLECRTRRIKCDESKPACTQCRRTHRSCSILESAFRPSSYTSLAVHESEQSTSDATEPPTLRSDLDFRLGSCQDRLESFSGPATAEAVAQSEGIDHGSAANSDLAAFEQAPENDPGNMDHGDHAHTSHSQATEDQQDDEAIRADSPASVTHAEDDSSEATVFFRIYAESLSAGIDLFTSGRSSTASMLRIAKAVRLIDVVARAAAAKQCGHIKHASLGTPRKVSTSSTLEESTYAQKYAMSTETDFLWYGAKYYGQAIKLMASDISLEAFTNAEASMSQTHWAEDTVDSPVSTNTRIRTLSTEARLLAACVMCQYEELSASKHAWASHLDGLFRLLHLRPRRIALLNATHPETSLSTSPRPSALRSFFWYFVHDDFEESFISWRSTRVDTRDKALWLEMGMAFDVADGHLHPVQTMADSGDDETTRDKAVLHMLLFILCRLSDHLAFRHRAAVPPVLSPASLPDQQSRASPIDWEDINIDVERLYAAVRHLLEPDILDLAEDVETRASVNTPLEKAWFLSSTSAMAATYFHMAKILLLKSMPGDLFAALSASPGGAPDWSVAYPKLHQQMASHARRILAIALGSPPIAVRLHMLQPLYVAGRCLGDVHHQDVLLDVLRGMEVDMGMATGYRVKDLLREWGRPSSFERSRLDRELSDLSSAED